MCVFIKKLFNKLLNKLCCKHRGPVRGPVKRNRLNGGVMDTRDKRFNYMVERPASTYKIPASVASDASFVNSW